MLWVVTYSFVRRNFRIDVIFFNNMDTVLKTLHLYMIFVGDVFLLLLCAAMCSMFINMCVYNILYVYEACFNILYVMFKALNVKCYTV